MNIFTVLPCFFIQMTSNLYLDPGPLRVHLWERALVTSLRKSLTNQVSPGFSVLVSNVHDSCENYNSNTINVIF